MKRFYPSLWPFQATSSASFYSFPPPSSHWSSSPLHRLAVCVMVGLILQSLMLGGTAPVFAQCAVPPNPPSPGDNTPLDPNDGDTVICSGADTEGIGTMADNLNITVDGTGSIDITSTVFGNAIGIFHDRTANGDVVINNNGVIDGNNRGILATVNNVNLNKTGSLTAIPSLGQAVQIGGASLSTGTVTIGNNGFIEGKKGGGILLFGNVTSLTNFNSIEGKFLDAINITGSANITNFDNTVIRGNASGIYRD